MRNVLLNIVVLSSVALLASGCDFFRTLAGRPTSADIEAKRQAIRIEEERKAALAAADTIAMQKDSVPEAVAVTQEAGKKRFYIVLATFSKEENARKFQSRIADKGYPGELMGFKGGYTAVGICGTDDESEIKESLKEIKRQDFCPEGVWIIDRNKR
ncbi:MAG: SPOR domain-containing protein [Bacteroidales bacterium]|nr:SPOR domain-containing protein [Bacteroidales bacterium]